MTDRTFSTSFARKGHTSTAVSTQTHKVRVNSYCLAFFLPWRNYDGIGRGSNRVLMRARLRLRWTLHYTVLNMQKRTRD